MELPVPDSSQSGKRWYVLGLGAATVFFVFAVATACMPVLFSEIAEKLGLSIVQIGTVWGASSVAGIFSILLAGMAADRFGTKRTILVGCLIAGVFGALRGLSDSFTTLVITSLLFGSAAEAVPVVVVKNTSQWFHGRGLATAQGIITAGVGGGMMLGAMLSATVLSPLLGGWNNVVILYGMLSIIVGLAWLTVKEPSRTGETGMMQGISPRQSFSHLLRIRGVWLVAIGMLGFAGCNRGVSGYLPLYLKNSGWTAAAADGAFAALNAAGTLAAIPLTLLSDRLGLRKTVIIPGLVITAISTGMLSFVTGQAAWVLVIMIGGVRDMIWAMAATIIVETKGVGLAYAGTAVGIVHTCTRIGYTIAPPIGNSLEEIQPGLAFVFWAGLSVAAVLAFLFVGETGRGR
jgi:MFS family permease